MINEARENTRQLVKSLFRNDYGEPFELTDSQADLFNIIWTKRFPRNQVIAPTQWGKSDTISMALVLRSYTFKEPFAIVAGSKEKAMIIMSRVIQHIFDNNIFIEALEFDKSMPLDRLKRERSKENIMWRRGGGVKVFTANTRNRQQVKESLTGFGSPNIVEDESSLVPDDVQAMILRMLGGHNNNFLLKIGNPFYRNHFFRSWNSSKYNKLFVDYQIALKEGRYTESFIEEMKNEPFFSILYECKFPENEEFVAGGYRQLFSDSIIQNAFVGETEFPNLDKENPRLGVDFAGGGSDRTVIVARWDKVAKVLHQNKNADTMQQIPIIEKYMNDLDVQPFNISLDVGGLGQGVGDRMHELDINVNRVMFGQKSPEPNKYKNMRSYMYYKALEWLKNGGKLVFDDSFFELTVVNYKQDSSSRLQIQPKEELKDMLHKLNLGVTSPDVADAFALTFADNSSIVDEEDIDLL